MSTSQKTKLRQAAAMQGWSIEDQLSVVLQYIENQNSPDAFCDFIDMKVEAERQQPQAIRVLVPCRDANGIPTLYPAIVHETEAGIAEGAHYAAAQKHADGLGFEIPSGPMCCIDESDAKVQGWPEKFNQFFE